MVSASETGLPNAWRTSSSRVDDLGRAGVDRPRPLRLQAQAGAVRAAPLVGAAVRGRRRPRGVDELGHREPGGEDLLAERGGVVGPDELVVDRGDRVLPQQVLGGHVRAQVARLGAHVAVEQLEPGAGVLVGEVLRVLVEPLGDLAQLRVGHEGDVGRRHHRGVALALDVRVGDELLRLGVLGLPLLGAGGALGELPLVGEQHLEVRVVPLGRRGGPRALEPAGDGVGALAGAVLADPAEAAAVHGAALGLRADELGVAGAVGLAEGVPARDERDRLLGVHAHPAEGHLDVVGGGQRVGPALRALGVDVDQPHGHRGEVALLQVQRRVLGVPLVAEPRVLGAPEDLLGLPGVLAAEPEAERLQAHVVVGDVAGEHEQVGPRDRAAVLLLDRQEQAAGLVEVGVVGPAVERGEALTARTAAAAAVGHAVGAGRVPAHPDEQRAVVAPVRRPPVLRRGHDLAEVRLEGVDVEARQRRLVVEVGAERVGVARRLVQHGQVDLVGPPVAVAARPVRHLDRRRLDRRVLALGGALGRRRGLRVGGRVVRLRAVDRGLGGRRAHVGLLWRCVGRDWRSGGSGASGGAVRPRRSSRSGPSRRPRPRRS